VSEPTPSAPVPVARTSWERHVVDPIAVQLTQGITPEKISLTLAVGSAFALFPILGTTTILCLIVGISLRLNQPIIQIVNALCTPLHLPVIYLMVRLGNVFFHVPYSHVGIRMMNHMLWDDPREFFEKFVLALPVMREVHLRRVVITQTVQTPPPEHPVP
jgi:uncharacterized protein (DUF2062 family)